FQQLVANGVDILFANQDEITALYQTQSVDDALTQLQQGGPSFTAVTQSANGCTIVTGGARYDVPAFPVARVVDTTGAGDLFAAGVLYGLSRDLPPETCGRLGCLAASEVISHMGARPQTSLASLVEEHMPEMTG
ncbi:MAG: PfkB family carbohydrate kinase, partial [Pseudomonadota bacterium]